MSAPAPARPGAGPPVPAWQRAFADRFTAPGASRARWASPVALAEAVDSTFRATPALRLIDDTLVRVMSTPDARLVLSMPPQEGKSTTANKWLTIWTLARRPATRVVVASYAASPARRMGRAIKDTITDHPQLGLRISDAVKGQSEFELAGHPGGVYSVGVGGSLTSRAADLMVIDDPFKDRVMAQSEVFRERVFDWWTDVAATRISPGGQVILVNTRWHQDDLAGRLLAKDSRWELLNIPAEADHRPDDGETDPLGREPGQFMISARGRTLQQWQQRKAEAGSRGWASMFQGRPTPASGDLLLREWFDGPDGARRYTAPLWIERDDGSRVVTDVDDTGVGAGGMLLQSWDLAFKGTKGSDYVVGQVWLTRGAHAYLLDQVRGRLDFPATVAAIRNLTARWPQALLKLVEDKANGPAVISSLNHEIPGIVPVEPDGGKIARVNAISPLVEAGNVHLPTVDVAPWVADLIDECVAFPGTHDDQVDALSQALARMVLAPLLAGEDLTVDSHDLIDDGDDYLGAWS